MFDDTYHTIAAPAEGLYKEKGSKFLAFAFPVHNTDEVKGHLERLRKEYFDARHCYAIIRLTHSPKNLSLTRYRRVSSTT